MGEMVLSLWRSARQTYFTTETLLRLIPVSVVVAAGVIATTWTHSLLITHQGNVVHTYEVIDTTKDVLIGLDDAETGERGYLLSGERRYLDPYQKALQRLTELRNVLAAYVSADLGSSFSMSELNGLIDKKLSELGQSIALHDQGDDKAAIALELRWMQLGTMDEIRARIGVLTELQRSFLADRQVKVNRDETLIRLVAILVALASILTRGVIEMYISSTKTNET